MNWAAWLEHLRSWLAERGLDRPHARWVVAVSGGPDSSLLLAGLSTLARSSERGWHLHVAHLHHGLRPQADDEACFVAEMADRLGWPHTIERVDVRTRQTIEGGSLEEVSRRHRYAFLERIALQTDSDCIALGHHADDNAETILHRICRGTGLRGLAGIAEIRPVHPGSRIRVVRPMLSLRRAEIVSLCAAHGIEYRVDSSNLTGEFTRGRLRNEVLPLLRATVNPQVDDALLRLAEQARWLGAYLEDAAARMLDSLVISEEPGRLVLNAAGLTSKQRIIQAEMARLALSIVLGGEQDLSFGHVEAVLRLAADRSSGKELHLPGPVYVRKHYDRLEFSLQGDDPHTAIEPVFIECPGATPVPVLGAELHVELCPARAGLVEERRQSANRYEEWLDADRVHLPLVLRGRKVGDRFWPLGAPGSKRLSEFFIDSKVGPHLRVRTGVLCDQKGPIWVIPLRIDERVKVRSTTSQVLHLTLRLRPPAE